MNNDELSYFEFRADAFSDIVRVEWPKGAPVALFECGTAMMMIRLGYGMNLNDDLMETFNELVDEENKKNPPPPAPPTTTTPAPTTTQPPDQSVSGKRGKKGQVSSQPVAAGTVSTDNGGESSEPPPAPGELPFPPDGWAVHPDSAGYFFKEQEVLTEAALRDRYNLPPSS